MFYRTKVLLLLLIFSIFTNQTFAQCMNENDVIENSNFKIHGPVDFTIIGNSQNIKENSDINLNDCKSFLPNLETSARLEVPLGDTIIGAYLYWSGSGEPIKQINLNDKIIKASRCWSSSFENVNQFSAYADVTNLVKDIGSGIYTLTNLNNTTTYQMQQCNNYRTILYGGWAMVVIFQNKETYNNSTLSFYDGFETLQFATKKISINTTIFEQSENSHIGIIAWEGDNDSFSGTNKEDKITLNKQILPSNGYTSPDNVFNGTNSFAKPVQTTYNVDIDNFDSSGIVDTYKNNGLTEFNFELQTGIDLIFLSTIVLKFPNEAPDAIISIEDLKDSCNGEIELAYTYTNENYAQKPLPSGTKINFFLNSVDSTLLAETKTKRILQNGESASDFISFNLPLNYSGEYNIIAYIDPPKSQNDSIGNVAELEESNNTSTIQGFNSFKLYFPEAFTPNNDGINDTFKGLSNFDCINSLTHYNLNIYNRYGNLIALIDDNNIGWEGNNKSEKAQPGMYTYYVEYATNDKMLLTQSGNVMLIR